MARENKLKGLRRADTEETTINAMENLITLDINEVKINFDYSALTEVEEMDLVLLKRYEKTLLHQGKQIGNISLEIGKALSKAREIFIKSHSESFVDWYTALGLDKDKVSILMNRYRISLDYPENLDKLLALPDRLIKQLSHKNNPVGLYEKVFSGEIKTSQEIKNIRENKSGAPEKFSNEIEEAQIIENERMVKFVEVQILLKKINNNFNKFEDSAFNQGFTKHKNIEILKEIVQLSKKLGIE